MALLGILLLLALHILLIFLIMPYGLPIPLILPFVYLIATVGFMATYAAFPVIEKYMIEPYQNETSADNSGELSE